jgi:hypothetical protein
VETFSCAQTKSEAIAMNVLESLANEGISKDLSEATFVTVSADEFNRKLVKLTPILIRLFYPMKGSKTKFVCVHHSGMKRFKSLLMEFKDRFVYIQSQRKLSSFVVITLI